MDHSAEDPSIRGPFQSQRNVEGLLLAILKELQAPPVRQDHSEAMLVLLASMLEELKEIRRLLETAQ